MRHDHLQLACPCGSYISYEDCCEPYIDQGLRINPEAWARARYAALVRHRRDFSVPNEESVVPMRHMMHVFQIARSASVHILSIDKQETRTCVVARIDLTIEAKKYVISEQCTITHIADLVLSVSIQQNCDSQIKKWLPKTIATTEIKMGRNDTCACGSGKKYKKCCLQAKK